MANRPPKFRWLIFLGLGCLALAVRLPRLGDRPMHTDEAVNSYITGQLLAGESYHYDHQDRHGPALYALALPLARWAGANRFAELNENTLRLGPVIVGVATVLLFMTVAPQIGWLAAIMAAGLWTVAPLPVYYSRYFIHETLFVAATLGFLSSGWRLLHTGSLGAGALTGLAAGLMLASKETAALSFAAAGLAAWWWLATKNTPRRPIPWPACAMALAAFLTVVVLLYSWGGQNWQGLAELARAVPRVWARAAGEGHEKPAAYYLTLLGSGWSGWPTLALALVGGVSAARNKSSSSAGALRLWLIYSIVIGALYVAIPYKTPWLALNLWLPLSLLAGWGATTIWRAAKKTASAREIRPRGGVSAGRGEVISRAKRGVILLGALALLALLARDTRARVFLQPANERNPYAYAHTGEDLLRLPGRLEKLAQPDSVIAVIAADPWPLPWYLRRLSRVGYWQPGPNPGAADFYLTAPEAAEPMKAQLAGWRPEFFGVRPGTLIILWQPEGKP